MGKSGIASALTKHLVPDLPQASEILPFLEQIDRNQWYSNFGPLIQEFEERVHHLLSTADPEPDRGTIHLTTLSSGYHALEFAVRALTSDRPGCVLLPAITFGACPLAIQHAGRSAVVTDVDSATWTLTPRIARAAIRHLEVSAVMPVSIYGVPLPTGEWDEFTDDTGIPVIIDAAAAFEVQMPPKHGLVAYSLHATKPLGIGEGGILLGRDPVVIEQARQYSNFGMLQRIVHSDGSNSKLSEYHAAVGLAQLQRWPQIKDKRRQLLSAYRHHIGKLSGVSFQSSVDAAVLSLLMLNIEEFSIQLPEDLPSLSPVAFHRSYLPPLYKHPHFHGLAVIGIDGRYVPGTETGIAKMRCMPNCELLSDHLIGVPFHAFMTEGDIAVVINELKTQILRRAA